MSVIVTEINIIGTSIVVYGAWEKSSLTEEHATVRHIEGQCYGQIGTKKVPEQLLQGLNREQRINAVNAWYTKEYARAYNEILKQYPELKRTNHKMNMGNIEIALEEVK